MNLRVLCVFDFVNFVVEIVLNTKARREDTEDTK